MIFKTICFHILLFSAAWSAVCCRLIASPFRCIDAPGKVVTVKDWLASVRHAMLSRDKRHGHREQRND
jgi:hypothetical protein